MRPGVDRTSRCRRSRGRPGRRAGRGRRTSDNAYLGQLRPRTITPVIARRGVEHGSGPGAHRWAVEQAFLGIARAITRRRHGSSRQGPRGHLTGPGFTHVTAIAPPRRTSAAMTRGGANTHH